MAGALSLDEQRAVMKATWPKFSERGIDRQTQKIRWIGKCRPQFVTYTLEIRYQLWKCPKVRVLTPELVRMPDNPEGAIPHVYPPADDPTLCLFDPAQHQWDPTLYIANTTVPWSYDWLACYELWLMTGRWTGGGRHGSLVTNNGAEA